MACTYSFDGGKTYVSEEQFIKELSKGKLDEFVNDGTIEFDKLRGGKKPLSEKVGISVQPPKTELSFSGLQNVANEFGYEDVKSRESVNDIQEKQNALNQINDWREEGIYTQKITDLLNNIRNRETVPTAKQRIVLQEYLADEIVKLRSLERNSKEYDEQLKKVRDIKDVGLIARQEAGAALRIGDTGSMGNPIDNYEDAEIAKMEALGLDKLTNTQKEKVKKQVDDYKKKSEEAEAKIKELQDKLNEIEAEKKIKELKKYSTRVKKSNEEYEKIREDIVKSIRETWQKAGKDGTLTAVPFPYAKQLGAITPKVAELAKTYLDQGYDTLTDVISKIREHLPEFSDREIRGMLAGEYNEPKPTRTELQQQYRDLVEESKLLNELERVMSGEPKNENQQIEKNQKLSELRKKITRFKKDEKEATQFYKETFEEDANKIRAAIKRNEKKTDEINEKIKNKDFSEEQKQPTIFKNAELKKKYPKLYNQMLDSIREKEEAEASYHKELLQDDLKRKGWKGQVSKNVGRSINTLKAIKTGIDLSGIGIQNLYAMLARPKTGGQALLASFKQLASKKEFDRWLTELKNTDMYPLMVESGLDITEPNSLKAAQEEAFSGRYTGKIPDAVLGGFERAYTSLGNANRALAFTNIATNYLNQGYTFEKNPELFRSIADRLNTQTGRGKLNEKVQAASDLVTKGVWSPRLMASRLNMLGVSDLASLIPNAEKFGTKGFYRNLDPKERKAALWDIGRSFGTVVALSAGLALATGGELDLDPLSPTFLSIVYPSGRSVNITGGLSSYIRNIVQFAAGRERKEGKLQESNRWTKLARFFRGKTPPVTGALISGLSGKTYMGEPTNLGKEFLKLAYPISFEPLIEGFQDSGAVGIVNAMPDFGISALGISLRDKEDFDGKDDSIEKLIDRNKLNSDFDASEIINYKKGKRPITEEEKEKFIEERNKIVEARLKKLWEGKDEENRFEVNGRKKTIPYSEMSRKEIAQATTNIKSSATRQAKKKLFGEKKSKIKERF